MRHLLVMLAIGLVAACSGAEKTDSAKDNAAPAPVEGSLSEAPPEPAEPALSVDDLRNQSLAEIDQEACKAGGGEVRQEGLLGTYRCVTPYADAGKACRSGSDCEGKCLATGDAVAGEEATGACQATDSPFGCYAEVEDGKASNALCVD